ncbi:acyl carrier protein [Enterococcus ureasiticus]|uniref:Carrier domain-containing protein n=1 Tax=Enterococcus ureasiticus TaxID=903984 RepID=A0A1E5GCN0_9ENTE|nr:acyl carrier protein [Enterococcus ureasiticus]OEG10345.1 hypothetical protein BCR21_13430 [Enterococcus ureasiticus]
MTSRIYIDLLETPSIDSITKEIQNLPLNIPINELGLDSLEFIKLFVDLEDTYHIDFDIDFFDSEKQISLQDIFDYIIFNSFSVYYNSTFTVSDLSEVASESGIIQNIESKETYYFEGESYSIVRQISNTPISIKKLVYNDLYSKDELVSFLSEMYEEDMIIIELPGV